MHKIQAMILRKPTDQQTYLHAPWNHPKSLKDSIPYRQTWCIKTVCSTISDFSKNFDIITKRLKERGYLKNLVNEQVDKVKNMKRKQLLSTNKWTIQSRIPESITYNRSLSNILSIITKNWSILQISPTLQNAFEKKPIKAYKINKAFTELIGGHTPEGRKVFKTLLQIVGNKAKGRISKRVFQETKHVKISEKRTFLTPWYA